MSKTFSLRLPITMIGMGSSNNIGDLVKELGAKKVIIVTDANVVKAGLLGNLKSSLEGAGCKFDTFDGCMPGAPSSTIEKCSQVVRSGNYDLLIAVGGGSTMDTVKAVSVMAPNDMSFPDFIGGKTINKLLPKILVPTTAGTGSEWSRVGVYYDDATGQRKLISGNHLVANAAVIDPELTLNLPQKVTADSGIDALTHAIESYLSPSANIISETFAEAAIKLISNNLRLAYAKGSGHPEARYKLSIAASMAMGAVSFSSAGMAHIMNSEIVKRVHITHGEACIMLLPHTMEFNLVACPERFAKIAELMGEKIEGLRVMDAAQKAVGAVIRLSKDIGMPQKLSGIGISESDIPQMADNVLETRSNVIQQNNPRPATRQDVVKIYTAAL